MIAMTLAEIADVIQAPPPRGADDVTVTSVEFDSRAVNAGALFVALPGEHADGHDFADAAARAGAVAVLGSREVEALPTLVVDGGEAGVLAALSALATHVAARLIADGLTVVGMTGSAGKTSTKDMTAALLSRAGSVVAPQESFNNELGHPYTVLRADRATDYLVLELSARGKGHIAGLARVAPPRIGAVLNVGSAHIGEFGSRDAIAVAKGELVEALPSARDGGVAILNADDERVAAMATRTTAAVVRTGVHHRADVRAENVTIDETACAAFTLATPEGNAPVHLRVVGAHQVANALSAAAIGRAIGMNVATVAEELSRATAASKWRMAVTEVPGLGGVTVINDAYNANPESMRAALEALARIGADRRRWAVLGEMAELGAAAPEAHREIGRTAMRFGIDLIVVGEGARGIEHGALEEYSAVAPGAARHGVSRPRYAPDIDTAITLLLGTLGPRDAVLVKASRSIGLERLAMRLVNELPGALAGDDPRDDDPHDDDPHDDDPHGDGRTRP